jgi:hypothetical protein
MPEKKPRQKPNFQCAKKKVADCSEVGANLFWDKIKDSVFWWWYASICMCILLYCALWKVEESRRIRHQGKCDFLSRIWFCHVLSVECLDLSTSLQSILSCALFCGISCPLHCDSWCPMSCSLFCKLCVLFTVLPSAPAVSGLWNVSLLFPVSWFSDL